MGRDALGIDVGGTFTDIVSWNGERLVTGKVSTTPDQSDGVVGGAVAALDGSRGDLIHGTTVATNALLERRGAITLLVGDAGFESVIEIARQDRPSLYDSFADRAEPLVPARRRIGVQLGGRPGTEQVERATATVVDAATVTGAEAVAICLLDAYDDPTSERRLRDALAGRLDVPISISSEVVAEHREYERASTTVLNAFLRPEVDHYLTNLRSRARESGRIESLSVLASSGGLLSTERAADLPAAILLSGPAGGVVAAAALSERMGAGTVVSFDMGGTSTDVCRIERGRPAVDHHRTIDGHACLLPAVAVHTVGAGGGSLAWVDDGGALRVGPRSAGASPGPACYGRGGTGATVTDANVVLGRIDSAARLGDDVRLRSDLALAACGRLGDRLGLSPVETAAGIVAVVESHMAGAIRAVSVEEGHDPRTADLVAFGGAGGLHAASLARSLDMVRAVVPPWAGVFSAVGLLLSPPRADAARTVNLTGDRHGELAGRVEELLAAATLRLAEDTGRAAASEAVWVDLRYAGQAHETTVPHTPGEPWPALRERFDRAHERRNGFARPDDPVEIVTVRAEAVGVPVLDGGTLPPPVFDSASTVTGRRVVHTVDGPEEATVWRRSALPPGSVVEGPAVIEGDDSTIWLGPGDTGLVNDLGAVEVTW